MLNSDLQILTYSITYLLITDKSSVSTLSLRKLHSLTTSILTLILFLVLYIYIFTSLHL